MITSMLGCGYYSYNNHYIESSVIIAIITTSSAFSIVKPQRPYAARLCPCGGIFRAVGPLPERVGQQEVGPAFPAVGGVIGVEHRERADKPMPHILCGLASGGRCIRGHADAVEALDEQDVSRADAHDPGGRGRDPTPLQTGRTEFYAEWLRNALP